MKKLVLFALLCASVFAADGLFRDPIKNIVVDTRTGLMWQDDDQVVAAQYTWTQALNQCSVSLNYQKFAGFSDWRVPNINELKSIISYDSAPAIFSVFNNRVLYFWSSTPQAVNSTASAWGVDFSKGMVLSYSQASARFVRCVRGNP